MLQRITHGVNWRLRAALLKMQGFTHFPWPKVFASALFSSQKHTDKIQLLVVGQRKGAKGGPQTKLQEMQRMVGTPRTPNALFVASGSPPSSSALRLAKRLGMKVILNQNGVYYPGISKDYTLRNQSIRAVHDLADFVVYQSEYCKQSYIQWVGPASSNHSICWNGVDTSRFVPAVNKLDRIQSQNTIKVLMTGSIGVETAYQLRPLSVLLKELNEVSHPYKIEFCFAGSVPKEQLLAFETLADAFPSENKNVTFRYLGTYASKDAPEIYGNHDVYLHLKYKDPCPNAVIEAMAAGLPVICGNSGGTPELVGEAGVIIPIEDSWDQDIALDAHELKTRLLSLDLNWIEAMSARARQRACAYFDLRAWAQHHLKSLEPWQK